MAVKASGPVLSEAARAAMSDPDIVGPQLDALLEGADNDPLVLSHLGTGADPVIEGAVADEQRDAGVPAGGDPPQDEPEEEESGEEEAGEAVEEPSAEDHAAETGEEGEEPSEESGAEGEGEGEGELSESELKLRQAEAENTALRALLEGGDIELDAPAAPPPATQPAVATPAAVEPAAPAAPAQPAQLAEPSAEEHAELMTDPAKFHVYTQNLVAMAEQRAMAVVPGVVQDLMRTEREVEKFFDNPDNADVASTGIQRHVMKYAVKLQGAGPNVTVTAALEAAADKVREKAGLPLKTATPKKRVVSGAKKTPKGKGGSKSFASPTSRRATSVDSGDGVEETRMQKQLDVLDTDD